MSEYGERATPSLAARLTLPHRRCAGADNPDHRYANISIPCGEKFSNHQIRVIKCYEQLHFTATTTTKAGIDSSMAIHYGH
ncbi:MAG: hypothetical protein ACNYPH_00655 [Gammaproteobacteria bacterium WSBS_2016_MAG_OTU1]